MTNRPSPAGCPWHGLISNYSLTLPNGSVMPMRQPVSGYTHLIDLGVASTETTAEEQSQGMEWLSRAILCDGQLHGVEIPRGSWIYNDSNSGTNWIVSIDDICTVNLTLSRFGEFYTPAETHQHTVPFPAVIADANAMYDGKVRTAFSELFHAKPDGSAAVFRVYAAGLDTISWLEFELSGSGDDITATAKILRNAEQTFGTVTETGEYPTIESFEYVDLGRLPTVRAKPDSGDDIDIGIYPDCNVGIYELIWDMRPVPNDLIPEEDRNKYYFDSFNFRSGTASYSSERVGAIIGVLYSAQGGIVEITADLTITADFDFSHPSVATTPRTQYMEVYARDDVEACWMIESSLDDSWSVETTQLGVSEYTATVSLRRNNVATLTAEISAKLEATTKTLTTVSGGELWRDYVYTETGIDPIIKSAHSTGNNMGQTSDNQPVWMRPLFSENPIGRGMRVELADSSGLSDFIERADYIDYFTYIDNNSQSMYLYPRRYANCVYGASFAKSDANDHGTELLTHEGVKTAPAVSAASTSPQASYNPITGAIARTEEDPVSWT